ncbi:hypothetical protein BH23THE1_BH23THE1_09390 [soil metagenome]
MIKSRGEEKTNAGLSIDPNKLFVIAPTLDLQEGSQIKQNDLSAIVISENIAKPPGEDNPFVTLGETIELEYSFIDATTGKQDRISKNFLVTAIMESTGNPTIDSAAVINLDAGDSLFQKSGKYDSLFVVAPSNELVDVVESEIKKLYGNDIGVTTVKAILKTIEQFTGGITSFLLSIAIISLNVGAVGIITTLYTSVIERIRETDTLKAIGAQSSNILTMFVFEDLIIGMLGATLGLFGGVGGGMHCPRLPSEMKVTLHSFPFFYDRYDYRMDNLCCPKSNRRIIAGLKAIKDKPYRSITTKNLGNICILICIWIKKNKSI